MKTKKKKKPIKKKTRHRHNSRKRTLVMSETTSTVSVPFKQQHFNALIMDVRTVKPVDIIQKIKITPQPEQVSQYMNEFNQLSKNSSDLQDQVNIMKEKLIQAQNMQKQALDNQAKALRTAREQCKIKVRTQEDQLQKQQNEFRKVTGRADHDLEQVKDLMIANDALLVHAHNATTRNELQELASLTNDFQLLQGRISEVSSML